MGRPPKVKNELDKAQEQFEKYDENIKELTMDRMNQIPVKETEPQTKLSTKEIDKSNELQLKPERRIGAQEKFNEKYREKYEYDKEIVNFIAENKEISGETIELWTKPYAGMPCEFWKVPTNKPVWGPRYLAEQIKRKFYHVLRMDQKVINSSDGMGQYFGQLVVDDTVPRLDARPVSKQRSVFMGATR